jgi:hypothetical protein
MLLPFDCLGECFGLSSQFSSLAAAVPELLKLCFGEAVKRAAISVEL